MAEELFSKWKEARKAVQKGRALDESAFMLTAVKEE